MPEAPRVGLLRALARRVSDFLVGHPAVATPRPPTTSTHTRATALTFATISRPLPGLALERRAVYLDLREMMRNDPIVQRGLKIIADCTVCLEDETKDGFDWTMALRNERALKVLNDMKARLDLGHEVWQIVFKFVLYGEEFREIVVNDEQLVTAFNSLPSYSVVPRFDALGNRLPGWDQHPEGLTLNRKLSFDEWQVVPFIFGPKQGFFGTGLMSSARRSWRRLQKLEDGLAIARMTRAYDARVHKVPVKPEWNLIKQLEAITNYKHSLTRRRGLDSENNTFLRDDPLTPETDIYIPDDGSKRGGVEVLAAQNMQLMNIEDLRYHQDALLTCLGVPRKYLNLQTKGSPLSDSSITAEDKQFARSLRHNQATLRGGLLVLARWALLFQGFDADELGVGVRMAKINVDDYLIAAKVQMNLAQAAQIFSQTLLVGGLPPELVMDKYMELNDEEKEVFRKFIKEQEADELALLRKEKAMAGARPGRLTTTADGGGGGPQKPTGQGWMGDDDEDVGASAEEIAQTLAKLGMLCQVEMERIGVPFSIGHAERLDHARAVIAEVAATNGV